MPGTCRVCWSVCWEKVAAGQVRCEDCTWALAQHPSSVIRRLLLDEPGLPVDVLELLATDFDAVVQTAAIDVLLRDHGLDRSVDADDLYDADDDLDDDLLADGPADGPDVEDGVPYSDPDGEDELGDHDTSDDLDFDSLLIDDTPVDYR